MKLFGMIAWPLLLITLYYREKLKSDVDIWVHNLRISDQISFARQILILLANSKEFRNLLYFRLQTFIGRRNIGFRWLLWLMRAMIRPVPDLFIWTPEIGEGLFIAHGNGTFIGARKIGKRCFVHHQVSIGYDFYNAPVIGDNVYIGVGAKIIGDIKVGSNVKIGANAVVIKDIPDNCTVVGVPAKIVKQDGKKVAQALN